MKTYWPNGITKVSTDKVQITIICSDGYTYTVSPDIVIKLDQSIAHDNPNVGYELPDFDVINPTQTPATDVTNSCPVPSIKVLNVPSGLGCSSCDSYQQCEDDCFPGGNFDSFPSIRNTLEFTSQTAFPNDGTVFSPHPDLEEKGEWDRTGASGYGTPRFIYPKDTSLHRFYFFYV